VTEIVYAEPENEAFVNGTCRRIKGVSFIKVLFTSFLACLMGMVVYANASAGFATQGILDNGVETSAVITNHVIRAGRGGGAYVTYQYTVAGHVYTQEEPVTQTGYDQMSIGSSIRVRYLADRPNEARLLGGYLRYTAAEVVYVLFGIFALFLIVFPFWAAWEDYRFARDGQLLNGTLIGVSGRRTKNGYRVTFEYTTYSPLGVELRGKTGVIRRDLRNNLPETGYPVKVLYIDDKHHRML